MCKPLSTAAISKVTGKAVDTSVPAMIREVQKAFVLPDDNLANFPDECSVCGTTEDIKYYRLDLERSYCSSCYHNIRIDLKPVIRS
jgi:hypothetical protein